jgi:hypothetical protein
MLNQVADGVWVRQSAWVRAMPGLHAETYD